VSRAVRPSRKKLSTKLVSGQGLQKQHRNYSFAGGLEHHRALPFAMQPIGYGLAARSLRLAIYM